MMTPLTWGKLRSPSFAPPTNRVMEPVLYSSSELRTRNKNRNYIHSCCICLYCYQILQVLSFQNRLVVIPLHCPTGQPSPPIPAGYDSWISSCPDPQIYNSAPCALSWTRRIRSSTAVPRHKHTPSVCVMLGRQDRSSSSYGGTGRCVLGE